MPAKIPIYLKTSTPKRGRKLRLREVLSSDMISPPLGDFRHSAHIGLDGEGDMFGELSFLQGKYDLLPHLGRGSSGSSLGLAEESFGRCLAGAGHRTLLKSAVSLPVFSGSQGQDQAPPKPPRLHLEEMPSGGQQRSMSVSCAGDSGFHSNQEGFSFSARAPCCYDPLLLPSSVSFSAPPPEGCFVGVSSCRVDSQECPCGTELPRSESLLQLDLDLGPSILDDVLRIMEEYQRPVPKAL